MADPWIRVHANLLAKPVTFRAADALRVKRPTAIGYLVTFWGAVSQHAKDGAVGTYSDAQLEAWAAWEGKRGLFANFIRDQHLDADGRVREWDEYAGALEHRRVVNRANQAAFRERRKASVSQRPEADISLTSGLRHNPTIRDDTRRYEEVLTTPPKRAKKPRVSVPAENWVADLVEWWVAHIGAITHGQLGKLAKPVHAAKGLEAIKAPALRYFGPNGKKGFRSVADFFATFAEWERETPVVRPIRPEPQPESPSERLARMGAL